VLYGREPRLGDLDDYNIGYEPSMFMRNLHENWLLARERICKQADTNKDCKIQNTKTNLIGDFVRVYMPQTKSGLKKKLLNDLCSEPWKISKVLSEQNIEITSNGKKPDRFEKLNKDVAYRNRFGRIIRPITYHTHHYH
ncbi:hypothetical protein BpHYR1_001126, partial [Brachionus plicatilis]